MDTDAWFDFSEQVVLITGGAGGIGREVALAFAGAGAHVIVADLDGDAAAEVAAHAGDHATSAALDVCDATAVEQLTEHIWTEHGHIDVLVNTAAVYVRVAAADLSEADFDRTMAVNVKGTWLLSQQVGRHMAERGRGRIINYASNAGNRGSALQVAYNASKAAIISITKSLAVEWGRTGVTVNAVAPGPTNTALMAPAFSDPAIIEGFAQRIPQGVLTPSDVTVGPVLFLASPMANSITGHVLYADGGMSAT
ncbi:MAG: SDR family oxidoreductase [Acidimicrobiia bacterium]|nr:SDR family oxidoreductase [Acidimicrobiia bacterium]